MPGGGHIGDTGHGGPRKQAQQGRSGAKSVRTMASAFIGDQEYTSKRFNVISLVCLNVTRSRRVGRGG